MKFLKFLLVIFLLLIFAGIGAVFFQNTIISYLTKTEKSEFLNAKYSIRTNELLFDDFVVNGKRLGKGRAKVELEKKGTFMLFPEIRLSEMKLENLDLNSVYTAPNVLIDGFMEKIDTPVSKEETVKTTEEFISDTEKQISTLNLSINEFVNSKIKGNIEKTNKIKEDYNSLTNLKSKAEKLNELNREATPLMKSINDEKEKIEYAVSDIEANRNIMMTNMSEDLIKLEKMVSLNDIQNINSYVLLDKGKEIVQSLNQSMKTVMLLDEIKGLSVHISDISINGNKVKVSGLKGGNAPLKGEILLDNNIRVNIGEAEGGYLLDYTVPDGSVKTVLEIDKKINAEITYVKKDILEGKNISLISNLIYENNNFRNENKTVLTEEEKTLLMEKIKVLEKTRYDEIINQYSAQVIKVDELIAGLYSKKSGLDKILKEIPVLNVTVKLDEIIGQFSQNGERIQGEQQAENGSTGNNTGENIQGGTQGDSENNVQNNTDSNNNQTKTDRNPQQQMQDILNKIKDKK